MPLDTIEDPFELSSYESAKHNFVIFYASRDDDGKMWCPAKHRHAAHLAPNEGQGSYSELRMRLTAYKLLIRRHRRHQDCRNVEEIIQRTFALADGPTGLIVYVGQRIEWKTGANFFRAAPWRIRSIPTVVKLQGAKEVGRLVEGQISSDLPTFVGSAVPTSPPTKDDSLTKDEPPTKDEPSSIKGEPSTKDELPTKDEPLAKDL
ncbi:hypothetical protein BJY52DRAFT_1226047 [Lactarius psammicola]|nr:hypothetical protein BJY52DRAFT_1226047 [Lactarius psammicola]